MQLNFKSQAISQLGSASQGNDQLLLRPDKMAPKDREKPVYDFQKNRTDSLQMPINFYMKGKEEGSVKGRELRYNMKVN